MQKAKLSVFELWFNSFFLNTSFDDTEEKESIEYIKLKTRLRWLFGTTIYLSAACTFLYVLALSSIHLTKHMSDKHLLEKIFFFASPTVWKNYVLGITGGFFNIFRKATHLEERVFIFFNLGLVILSFANLVMALVTIHSSCSKNCNKLRVLCLPLCFPALGFFAFIPFMVYFCITHNKEKIKLWAYRHTFLGSGLKKYFEHKDFKLAEKFAFKPKTHEFLVIKKKPKTFLDYLNQIEQLAV